MLGLGEELSITGPLPEWAKSLDLRDKRGTLPWDTDQYIALVGLGDVCMEACLDTGGGRSMMDLDTCRSLGIKWT